jgi:hypothetical protein
MNAQYSGGGGGGAVCRSINVWALQRRSDLCNRQFAKKVCDKYCGQFTLVHIVQLQLLIYVRLCFNFMNSLESLIVDSNSYVAQEADMIKSTTLIPNFP